MIYGYARVSTATQSRDGNSLEEQVAALTAYGCQEIIQEAFTGKTMERPAFQSLLGKLTESDMLVVTKLDRFARTAIQGVQTVRDLFQRGVKVHILNMGLVENTLTGLRTQRVPFRHMTHQNGRQQIFSSVFVRLPNPSRHQGRARRENNRPPGSLQRRAIFRSPA